MVEMNIYIYIYNVKLQNPQTIRDRAYQALSELPLAKLNYKGIVKDLIYQSLLFKKACLSFRYKSLSVQFQKLYKSIKVR